MFLIFADLHIHPHKHSNDRLEDCLLVLDWIFKVAKEKEVSHVIFAGDLFHDRQKIDVFTYQRAFEIFQSNSKESFEVILLLGNHDLWHSNLYSVSSVYPLATVDNIHVVSTPETLSLDGHQVAFLPYTKDPVADLKDLPGDILFGHVAIDGAIWNVRFGTRAEVTIEHDGDMDIVTPEIFDGWKRVFLGHYHAEQKLSPTVEYIGSPLQLSFGEAFQHKHIIIYDPKTDKREYIRNTFSPQHFVIQESDLEKYDLNNNFIRVIVEDISASDVIEMRQKLLEENNVGSLEIQQQPKQVQRHEIDKAKSILFKEEEMLERYIDEVGTDGLDKDLLLKIGKYIVEKVKGKQT